MQGLNRYFLVDFVRAGTEVHVILISLSSVGTRDIQCVFVVSCHFSYRFSQGQKLHSPPTMAGGHVWGGERKQTDAFG